MSYEKEETKLETKNGQKNSEISRTQQESKMAKAHQRRLSSMETRYDRSNQRRDLSPRVGENSLRSCCWWRNFRNVSNNDASTLTKSRIS